MMTISCYDFYEHMKWREQNNVDTILQDFEPPEVMKKYYAGGLFGQDKEGALLWIEPRGYMDVKGIFMSMGKHDLIRSEIWRMEEIYRQFAFKSKEQGRRVDQIVIIDDYENYGKKQLWKFGVDVNKEVYSIIQDNYPETVKKTFLVNAPRCLVIVFKFMGTLLTEETGRKFTVCDGNYKETLLQYIDRDQLPKHWGGTCVDPDGNPRCPSQICQGGDVPETYYRQNQFINMSGFVAVSIRCLSSLRLDFVIHRANSAIRWQFKTDGFDIGFGVFRQTTNHRQKVNDMEPIVPSQRINSHLVPEDGRVTCTSPGIYIVRFDNTYSFIRAKKLYYLIEILDQTYKC